MNERLLKIVKHSKSFIVNATFTIVVLYFLFSHLLNIINGYRTIDDKTSQNGRYTITRFEAVGENIYAPYGTILALSGKRVGSPKDGHVIFGGYCSNGMKYEWKSPENIEIICEKTNDEISSYTESSIASGIKIHVENIVHPNKSLKVAP